ncbi:MAG: hypothetical protein LQ338_005612 [Usnochroma carphineum]|nr:MAG: hypothetical protein LQ338_005612 [Usnochroma carphineum]
MPPDPYVNHINVPRAKWEIWFDEDGDPNDCNGWKLFDPSETDLKFILEEIRVQSITVSRWSEGAVSYIVPRFVVSLIRLFNIMQRLSDSGLGLIVSLGPTQAQLRLWYPLDFGTNGKPRRKRESFGHAWVTEGRPTRFHEIVYAGDNQEQASLRKLPPVEVDRKGNVPADGRHPSQSSPTQQVGEYTASTSAVLNTPATEEFERDTSLCEPQ